MFCSKYALSESSISFCTCTPKLYMGRSPKEDRTDIFSSPMEFSYALKITDSGGKI